MMIHDLTLIKSIGKGSFGEVFLTSKAGTDKKFATKKVQKSMLQGKVKELFNNEVHILKAINHPHIIKLEQIEQTLNNFYLVFELCNGGGLSNCLEKYKNRHNGKAFPEATVQYIMKQIISAISYLHNQKIIHRDLKLDNILVNFENEKDKEMLDLTKANIKIIDFGFARYLAQDSLAQSVLGSPINMDPVILKKMNKVETQSFGYDQKADIWSLGTICYELLIGMPPFDGNNMDDLMRKITNGEYKIPRTLNLSLECISFINGMLQNDPKRRLDINQLAHHNFLVKKPSQFQPMEIKKSIFVDTPGNEITLNTKQERGIWLLFDGNDGGDLKNVKADDMVKPYEDNGPSGKGISDASPDYFGDLDNQMKDVAIDTEQRDKIQNVGSGEFKSIEITSDLKNLLTSTFDKMNQEYIYIEPMAIPLIPNIDQKHLDLNI